MADDGDDPAMLIRDALGIESGDGANCVFPKIPRWQEAFEAGQAARVVLRATHEGALAYCSR
jgi:uncharacterized protein (DUF2237 family)